MDELIKQRNQYEYRTVRIRGSRLKCLANEFVNMLHVKGTAYMTFSPENDLIISGWIKGADYQYFIQCHIKLFKGLEVVTDA